MGPTASGKTDIALHLAQKYRFSVISVDSSAVYRGMDIGTAKPSREIRNVVPHALIDIRDPEEDYSVSEFVDDADLEVQRIFTSGDTPLLVGGTMLYFKGFREGIATLPSRNADFRSRLRNRVVEEGVPTLHRELQTIDPVAAQGIHPNNYVRIERALEVHALTGESMSTLLDENAGQSSTDRLQCKYVEFALLNIERPELHARIATRLDSMLELGFEDEVRTLMQRPGLDSHATSMRTVGYRQLWEFLSESPKHSIDETTKDAILAATRRLARRQCTWLRSWKNQSEHHQVNDESSLPLIEAEVRRLGVPRRSN